MGMISDNNPENSIRIRKLIDQSGNVEFIRIYNIDSDGITILSIKDIDLAGVDYTPVGTVIDGEVSQGGGSGETNTGTNIGVSGIGVFKQKTGTTLEFKKLNPGSNKITIIDDTLDNEIEIDFNPSNVGTSELNNDANFIDAAGAPVQTSDIADFETSTQLNSRDVDNRNRANHTGTQTANTISDFDTEVSNNTNVALNTSKVSFVEAPNDGQQYARQSLGWSVITGGGGGVTDHGALTGLADDDHTQYLNETRHDSLPADNPHSVTKSQVGLGNADNTSDVNKPVSIAQAAANTQDRDRTNHTGTQLSSTISDFTARVKIDETTTSLTVDGTGSLLTFNDEDGGANNIQLNVFGTEFEDFINTTNVNITTTTPTVARFFSTATKPPGRYRIQMEVQLEPNSASSNYLLQLQIFGIGQIGLEMSEEGKDVAGDNRNIRVLKGYYDHTAQGTFDIDLVASRESGTLVIHGVTAEVWRVS